MVPSSDSTGRSVSLGATVAPQIQRSASLLVSKKTFGFGSVQDVVRWCLEYGLTELSRRYHDKELAAEIDVFNQYQQLIGRELEYTYYEEGFERIKRGIKTLIEKGHGQKAYASAMFIWQSHDRCEDPYWRERFRALAKEVLDMASEHKDKEDRKASGKTAGGTRGGKR